MKVIKYIFKWVGIVIWLFLIFVFMQVPALESTPVYSMDSQHQFFEAFKHVNFLHNIFNDGDFYYYIWNGMVCLHMAKE